jgi:hypothetical protein
MGENKTDSITANITDSITANMTDSITANMAKIIPANMANSITTNITDSITANMTDKIRVIEIPVDEHYYLVEFRSRIGFDSDLPDDGILVMLIDERKGIQEGTVEFIPLDQESNYKQFIDLEHNLKIEFQYISYEMIQVEVTFTNVYSLQSLF